MQSADESKSGMSGVANDDNVQAVPQSDESKERQYISPLFNDLFLRLFGSQDSKDVTRSLVNAILRHVNIDTIGEVRELRCDVTSAGGIAVRSARVDVLVVPGGGAIVDLEAQRERVNVDNKALFYASKLLCEHTPKGGPKDYSVLPQVVVIMLVEGWERFEDKAFLHVGRPMWKSEDGIENGSDRILFVIAELNKVRKRYTVDDGELATDEGLAWLYLLAKGYREDDMDEVMKCFPTMREFAEHYKIALGDPELKRAYERYCEARTEYNDMVREGQLWARKVGRDEGYKDGRDEGYKDGRDEGYKEGHDEGYKEGHDEGHNEGRKEGRKEGLEEVAGRMREMGYDNDTIDDIMSGLKESSEC